MAFSMREALLGAREIPTTPEALAGATDPDEDEDLQDLPPAPADPPAATSPARRDPTPPGAGRMVTTGGTTTRTRTKADRRFEQAVADESQAIDAEKQAILKQQDAQAEIERRRAQAQDEQAAILQQKTDQQTKILQQGEDRKRIALARAAELDRKWSQAEPEDFWEDKSMVQKVAAGIGLIFGGAAGGGRHNEFADFLQREMESHYAQERERIQKIGERAKQARVDADKVDAWMADELARLDIVDANRLDYVAKKMEADAARMGVDLSQHQAGQVIAQLDQKSAQRRAEAFEKLNETITTSTQRQLVAPQAPASPGDVDPSKMSPKERQEYGFAIRMERQGEAISNLANKVSRDDLKKITDWQAKMAATEGGSLFSRGARYFGRGIGAIPDFDRLGVSEAAKNYYVALREFAAAALRRESGAAITEAEMADQIARVGLRPGDPKSNREMKLRNMRDQIRTAYLGAGVDWQPPGQEDRQDAIVEWAEKNVDSQDPEIRRRAFAVLRKVGKI